MLDCSTIWKCLVSDTGWILLDSLVLDLDAGLDCATLVLGVPRFGCRLECAGLKYNIVSAPQHEVQVRISVKLSRTAGGSTQFLDSLNDNFSKRPKRVVGIHLY